MKSLREVLDNKLTGLHYGNRILLPFGAHVLKAVVENDIVMDFSNAKKGAAYNITRDFTELYFYDYRDLSEVVTEYETIKLVCVENGKDVFTLSNHVKIALYLKEKHILEIEELNDDILFLE
ncbi:MAG: hypothetical protein JW995_04405 [Melioribacteraceae bacterium]|nr:hypothetical protein [Melioribacteraceae bacterium]